VRRARLARDEGSEVLGSAGDPRRVVLALAPRRFLDPPALEELALHELSYAEDMLDPAFAFVPSFDPGPVEGHARAELVRDRLRVLWQARVRGRLARRGEQNAPPAAPTAEFRQAFGPSTATEDLDALFADAWSGALATYATLLAAARDGAPAGAHQASGA
jgi:hypothetical protein